ncbi:MAG: hypothetical protein AB7U20_05715 [Planctomycetaceae bacterium]
MQQQGPIVVLKVGGSLLSLPGLSGRLQAIVREFQDARLLIVCGGGEAADVVRRWQDVHSLTDEQAHWLAFRAVSLNEALLSHLLPGAVIVPSRDEMRRAWSAGRLPILAVEAFTRTEEPQASLRLPHDWTVTSDSLAVWVAVQLGEQRVVLGKSCDLVPENSHREAAARGLVDAHFPVCAAGLTIHWINLRAAEPRLNAWPDAQEPRQAEPASLV